jgi:hypothetical protein
MVSIPRLNRAEPTTALPKNDRINMRVQDQGSNILNTTQSISSVAHEVGDIYQKYENDKIDQLASSAEQEYTKWIDGELRNIKSKEGDPTDHYADLDKRAKEKYDAILSSRPDMNERVRSHVTSRLDKSVNNTSVAVDKQRGMQEEVYDNNVYESGLKLKKDGLSVTAGYIQKEDSSSFLMYDQNLADIKTSVVRQGLKKGTVTKLPADAESGFNHVYKDDDGSIVKVQMTDIAKQRAAKEMSEGVKSSIDVMIASGRVEEAKQTQERYKDYIDPLSKAKLQEKFSNADRKTEAYGFIATIRGKSQEQQISAIDAIKDPELRSEALKIKDADDAKIESMRKRKSETNYNTLANRVINKMNSEEPYHGIADLESDPLYKQTWDNIDPKKKQAILEQVEAPKNSNTTVELKVQDIVFGRSEKKLEDYTPEEWAEATVGLNRSAKSRYSKFYVDSKTQTGAEKRGVYTQAGKALQDQLLIDRKIKKDKYGNLSSRDEIKLKEMNNELMDELASHPGNMDPKQVKDFVKSFTAGTLKKNFYNPQPNPATSKQAKTTPSGKIPITRTQLNNFVRLYSKKNNGIIPTQDDPKFINFVQQNLGR